MGTNETLTVEQIETLMVKRLNTIIASIPILWSPRARWTVDLIRYPELRQTVPEDIQRILDGGYQRDDVVYGSSFRVLTEWDWYRHDYRMKHGRDSVAP